MFLANRAHFSITSRNLPNEHFLSFHCLWLIQKKQAAQRAQFPANERTFEKWLFSNLTVPRAEIGKTSRFGFLEQKFARAEISHMPKRWLHPGTACLTATRGEEKWNESEGSYEPGNTMGFFYAEYRLSTATKHPEHGRMMEIDVVLESGHALAGWARGHLLPTLLQNVPGARGGGEGVSGDKSPCRTQTCPSLAEARVSSI